MLIAAFATTEPLLDTLRRGLALAGLDKRRRPDRRVLEQLIFPWLLVQRDLQRILFVGCAWYTQRYNAVFAGKAFCTLEPDRRAARYGAPRHLPIGLESLDQHVPAGSFDAIVCNGVLGWGIDEPSVADRAFAACERALRPGGLLVVGWNDQPRRRGRQLMAVPALARFRPVVCPPLSATVYRTGSRNGHTYSFFLRPAT